MADVRFDRVHCLDYLTLIYNGAPGYLQVCSNLSWVGRFFATDEDGLADAVNFAAELDRRGAKGVYHRVTTVRDIPKNGERGGAEDTLWMPGSWGDLDFGEDGHKKGSALPPTTEAAIKAMQDSPVPEPTLLVHSGGGIYPLHLINPRGVLVDSPDTLKWIGEFSIMVQRAYLYGHLLNGWSYGTGVSDLARVIRLAGSVNRKIATPRACRVIGGSRRLVSTSDFTEPDAAQITAMAKGLAEVDPTAVPHQPLPQRVQTHDPNRERGVLDVIAEQGWRMILEADGWTHTGSDAAGELWLRPGDASSEYSGRVLFDEPNVIVCHSESTALPSGAGQRLTVARTYSYLAGYRGDMSETARALIRGENPLGLPAAVFDEIDRVMAARQAAWWARESAWLVALGVNLPALPAPNAPPAAVQAPTPAPLPEVDQATLEAFTATFDADPCPWMADNRARWMRDAIAGSTDKMAAWTYHAVKAFVDVIQQRYSAASALRFLEHLCPASPDDRNHRLRVALAAALATLEGASE